MAGSAESRTSPTLLGRLGRDPMDAAAWEEFVRRYGPRIHGWCRSWNLQEADAEDVTQSVLLRLAQKMRTFTYDPTRSFRAWLRTLTRHAWSEFVEDRRRAPGSGDSRFREWLESLKAPEDLLKRLEEEFDRELLDEALVRVQLSVTPERWEAFRLTALEGMSGAEAARKLSLKVATVYSMRSKVQKLVRAEMNKLEKLGLEPPTP